MSGPPKEESTEDALEKLFAEAMGSVRSAKTEAKREPSAEVEMPALELPSIDVEIAEAFLDEQSMHYVIDEEDSSELKIAADVRPPEGLADLDAELRAALEEQSTDGDDDDIDRFIKESFGENALSDEDPDLAFPSFLDESEEEEDDYDDDPSGEAAPDGELELFAVDIEGEPREIAADVGRPAGSAAKARQSTTSKRKIALPGPSIDDALRARVAELGRVLEERNYEVRAARDRINALNAELVAANRRGAAVSREFETFRQRAARDREDHKKYAAEKVLKEFLGVFDNLQRALEHAGPERDGPLGQGVSMTLHQFESALAQNTVERVPGTVGAKFDPVHHEAVGQAFSDDIPQGAIVSEMQAGFTLHGRLLRAALVTVSRGPEGGAESRGNEDDVTAPPDGSDAEEASAEEASAEEASAEEGSAEEGSAEEAPPDPDGSVEAEESDPEDGGGEEAPPDPAASEPEESTPTSDDGPSTSEESVPAA